MQFRDIGGFDKSPDEADLMIGIDDAVEIEGREFDLIADGQLDAGRAGRARALRATRSDPIRSDSIRFEIKFNSTLYRRYKHMNIRCEIDLFTGSEG